MNRTIIRAPYICPHLGAVALLLTCLMQATIVQAVDFTFTNGGVAGQWDDVDNWGGVSFPTGSTAHAIIPDGLGAAFTSGIPSSIWKISTGDTAVSFNSGISLGGANNAGINVGSGGVTFGGTMVFPNSGGFINAAGNLTAPTTQFGNGGHSVTQSAGVFDINSFSLRNFQVVAWDFAPNKPVSFNGNNNGTVLFAQTPVFSAGHRPDWNMGAGGANNRWDINGQTLLADDISLLGHPNLDRYSYLYNNISGGVIDTNTFTMSAQLNNNYVDLTDTTVTVRGNGTAWNNATSTNVTPYQMTNTLVTLDPTAGSLNIDPGSSEDAGTGGFVDNFAFDSVTIAAGDTVGVVGNANVGSAGATALYVNGTLTGEAGSTLDLDEGGTAHSAYVNGALQAGTTTGTFTVNGGDVYLTNSAEFLAQLDGLGNNNQLVLTGSGSETIHLNDADLSLTLSPSVQNGLYFLIDNQTGNAIDGTFSGLAQGDFITGIPGFTSLARISYLGDLGTNSFLGGNDLVLSIVPPVPEPSSLFLLLIGCVTLRITRSKRLRN